jgi:crotonobetainyl-CoA:carnitine CoA-transferase CaiB-like acyl-CoA transferase
MDRPAWATADCMAGTSGRVGRQDEIDRALESWTRSRVAQELMQRLQRAGVPAGVVQNHRDLTLHDRQIEHRGTFPRVHHELLGEYLIDGLPIRLSATPGGVRKRAPLWGEHTDEVIAGILGYRPEQVAALREQQVLA